MAKQKPPTLTRRELAEILRRELGSYTSAMAVVTSYFEELERALIAEGVVKIHNFGRFETSNKKERMGRNPRSGAAKVITARKVVKFRPCGKFRDAVRNNLDETDAQD